MELKMGSGESLAMQVLSPFGTSRHARHPEWTSLFEDAVTYRTEDLPC